MKLYEKPELTKVDVLASERLMNNCEPVGSEGPNLPGIDCEIDTPES